MKGRAQRAAGAAHWPLPHLQLADLAQRHRWIRALLHVAAIVRRPRNACWHSKCIQREFHEFLNEK